MKYVSLQLEILYEKRRDKLYVTLLNPTTTFFLSQKDELKRKKLEVKGRIVRQLTT